MTAVPNGLLRKHPGHDAVVMRDRFLWLARQFEASPTPLATIPF